MELVDIEKTHIAHEHDFEQDILNVDLKNLIHAEVDKLPAKQKIALSLRIFEDLSFAEIAEIMKCPYDTAKANYRHALIKLRHTIGDQADLRCFLPTHIKDRMEADA